MWEEARENQGRRRNMRGRRGEMQGGVGRRRETQWDTRDRKHTKGQEGVRRAKRNTMLAHWGKKHANMRKISWKSAGAIKKTRSGNGREKSAAEGNRDIRNERKRKSHTAINKAVEDEWHESHNKQMDKNGWCEARERKKLQRNVIRECTGTDNCRNNAGSRGMFDRKWKSVIPCPFTLIYLRILSLSF